MKKLIILILILTTLLTLTACTKNKSALGSIKNSIYINKYFDFQLSLPKTWKYYEDKERYDVTINFNINQTQTTLKDFSEANTILLMILYRDENIQKAQPDEHSEHVHDHITPILYPGIVINAIKGKEIPEAARKVTINNFKMYQEDIVNGNEMYTYLYYIKTDFTILFKLNYQDENQALLVMDIFNTISHTK